MPATSRPAHAHIRTVQVSVFSSVQSRAEQETDGNGRMARLPLLGGAPPVDLLRLDARRDCRRKHPDALDQTTRPGLSRATPFNVARLDAPLPSPRFLPTPLEVR